MNNQSLLYSKNYMSSLQKISPELFRKQDILGRFLLHRIAAKCDVESAKYCIKQFPQALIEEDYDGNLPIHIAVVHRNDEVARLMISIKPSLGIETDGHGRTLTDLRNGDRSDSLWFEKENCWCNIM